MTNVKIDRKDVIRDKEFQAMLEKARETPEEYFRLRALALLSIFRRFGKRRSEVGALECNDLTIKGENLSITFTVVKKRKKSKIAKRREKQVPLSDPLSHHIIKYWNWMRINQPRCKYLFPSTRSVFGGPLIFYENKHISGRQLLRIIKKLNPKAWCHLFRETVGAEIVKEDPSLIGVYKVMMRLDLEKETTAWNYMRRHAVDVVKEGSHED